MKTKPSTCLAALQRELLTLTKLDQKNQLKYAAGIGRDGLSKAQMHMLTEAVFFSAFRAYEQFLRNIFLLYCCEKQSSHRKQVRSFLNAKSLSHAESLIKSSMPFLDWSSPDALLERAEVYLKDGHPLKAPLSSNLTRLRPLKKIRNHIAHMSPESLEEYKKVIKVHYGTVPLTTPPVGEYLLLPCRHRRTTYYLTDYMDLILQVGSAMT